MTTNPHDDRHSRIDRLTAVPMAVAALLSLLALAGLLHFLADDALPRGLAICCALLMVLVYPAFLVEAAVDLIYRTRSVKLVLLYLLLPPFRLTARDRRERTDMWLPGYGWRTVDDDLGEQLQRNMSIPMMGVALLVLPLVAMEFAWADQIETNATLSLLVTAATALIWFAFTMEFLVMISVVPKKIDYCKRHWIDIIVILLPLVAFLRILRLGGLLRMNQVSKTVRLYKMRGILTRTYRAVLILNLIDRVLRPKPEQQLRHLRQQEAAKLEELEAIRRRITAVVQRYDIALDDIPSNDVSGGSGSSSQVA